MLTTVFVVSGFLEILLPLLLGLYLWRKFGARWKVFFVGLAAFIISQIIHVPLLYGFNWIFSQTAIEHTWSESALVLLNAVVLGLMSGLCEEPLRWLSFKYLKEEGSSFRANLMLGAGHGGIESILVGVNVIGTAITLILWKNGSVPIPIEQIPLMDSLVATDWYLPLLGVFERICAIILHLSLSSLVWLSVRNKKASFLILAIAWHALVNGVVVYLSGIGWSPIALEGVMAIATVFSVVVLRQIYQKYGKDSLYALEKLPSEAPLQDAS